MGPMNGNVSVTKRAREIRDAAEEATAAEMRRIHESGELKHLYGRPLQLDDHPDWLATKILKKEGFSHPLIERGRELDEPRRKVNAVVERLKGRHARLTRLGYRYSAEDADAFNRLRSGALEELSDKLTFLNRAIRDFNLQAPEALHQRPVSIQDTVARVGREVPSLYTPTAADDLHQPKRSHRRRVFGGS
jgi:hypothetical protein